MKRTMIIVMSLAFCLTTQAQVLSLDSCLNLARQNNHQLRQQHYAVEKAQQVRNEVRTKYFPQVQAQAVGYHSLHPYIEYGIDDIEHAGVRDILNTLYGNYGAALGLPNSISLLQKGVVAGVSAVQPVYMGGKIVAGNRLAKVGVEAAELQEQIAERDLLLQVEESYWLVVGLEEKQKTVEAAAVLLDTLQQVVLASANVGLAMPADILKVELKQSELEAQTLQLTNGIRLARRALCQSIGIDYTDSLQLENVTEDSINAPMVNGQMTNDARPEYQLLALQVRAAQLEKRMTLADALPHVAVGGAYAYNNLLDKDRLNGSLFCMVQVPLTAWWETGHKLKEHDIAIRQAQEQQTDLNEKMLLQTQQAFDRWTEKSALVTQQRKAYAIAEEHYRLTLLNYQAGYATISDLLEAHTTLYQTSNTLTDARLSTRLAWRQYNALTEQ